MTMNAGTSENQFALFSHQQIRQVEMVRPLASKTSVEDGATTAGRILEDFGRILYM